MEKAKMMKIYEEKFDSEILASIYRSMKKRDDKMYINDTEIEAGTVKIIKDMLVQSFDGVNRVHYQQKIHGKGRRFVQKSGIQRLWKNIRDMICKNYYIDLDFVNAHPTILKHWAESKELATPCLNQYVENRNEVFELLAVSKDVGKKEILKIINGGSSSINHEYIKNLCSEMKRLQSTAILEFPEYLEHVINNPKDEHQYDNHGGRVINLLLCDYENQALQILETELTRRGFTVGVLMFDGCLVEKHTGLTQELFDEISDIIATRLDGLQLKIISKPMTESIHYDDPYINLKEHLEQDKHLMYCVERRSFFVKHNPHSELVEYNKAQLEDYLKPYKVEINTFGGIQLCSFFNIWLSDINRRTVNRIVCVPPHHHLKLNHDDFNLWKGFEHDKLEWSDDFYDDEGVKTIMNHIKFLFHNNYELVHKFTGWVAHMIQRPGEKLRLAWLIKSEEGAGKGLMFRFLSNMLGRDKSFLASSFESIFDTHSLMRKDRLLIGVDEINGSDQRKYKERLKNAISENYSDFNPKFVNTFVNYPVYERYLCFTNNEMSMFIDKSNSRLICHECKQIPTEDHITQLLRYIDDESTIQKMFSFFKNFDLSTWNHRVIETPYTKELKRDCLSNVYRFMEDAYNFHQEDYEDEIRASDLYHFYQTFCRGEHITPLSTKFFYSQLIKNFDIKKRRKTDGIYYMLQFNEIREKLEEVGFEFD